ncbi:glycerophosphoinositol permease [Rhodotorula sphaerocarpa]
MATELHSSSQAKARFGLGKYGLIFACGTALFSDGYVNAVAGSVNTILSRIYPNEYGKNHYSTLFSGMAYLGTIIGQLSFGYFVDRYGRKWGMLAASTIMIIGSALCAGAYGYHGSVQGMFTALIVYRLLTGIGIGAEYPSGSVAASENTENPGVPRRWQHGLFVLATNSMIDIGFVVGGKLLVSASRLLSAYAPLVPLVLLYIFNNNNLGAVWRLTFGLGIVPAGLVLLWRLRMPQEPERYRKSAIRKNVPYRLLFKRYWRSLLGVSLCWFLYDFITYPFGLFSSKIVDIITGGSTKLSTVFIWGLVINAFYVPGTVIGAFLVDWIGPKKQLMLFLCLQGVTGFFMSGFYEKLTEHVAGFAVIYGVFLSFDGIAAAIGKIGAYVGVWAFPAIIADFPAGPKQTSGPFWVGSGLAFLSALIAFFLIPEAKMDGMTLEDERFREYLAAEGYDVSQMGTHSQLSSGESAFEEGAAADDDKKVVESSY